MGQREECPLVNKTLKGKGYRDGIKERRQDRDGVWVTAHNGITQCAMPTSQ